MNAQSIGQLLAQKIGMERQEALQMGAQLFDLFEKARSKPNFPSQCLPAHHWDNSAGLQQSVASFFKQDDSLSPKPKGLYGIINISPQSPAKTLYGLGEAMCLGGVAIIQIRAKKCAPQMIQEVGQNLQPLLAKYGVPLIINDHAQIAAGIQAFGVHVGQDDPNAELIGQQWPHLQVGLSTHSLAQALKAEDIDAISMVALGPIFESPTKKGHATPVGLPQLAYIRSQVSKPLIAIGGLSSMDDAFEMGKNGADYGATISALAQPQKTRLNAICLGFALWLGQQMAGSNK